MGAAPAAAELAIGNIVRRVLHMVREEQQGSEDSAEGAKPAADATKADKVRAWRQTAAGMDYLPS